MAGKPYKRTPKMRARMSELMKQEWRKPGVRDQRLRALQSAHHLGTRCGKPCGLHDAKRINTHKKGLEHSCTEDWGHPQPCDFISGCGRSSLNN